MSKYRWYEDEFELVASIANRKLLGVLCAVYDTLEHQSPLSYRQERTHFIYQGDKPLERIDVTHCRSTDNKGNWNYSSWDVCKYSLPTPEDIANDDY